MVAYLKRTMSRPFGSSLSRTARLLVHKLKPNDFGYQRT